MSRKVIMDLGALHELKNEELAFNFLKQGGFKYYDYSLYWKGETEHIGVGEDFRENALKVKNLSTKYDLECAQTHSYFTRGISEEDIQRRNDYIKKEIETTSILGAKIMVLHPITDWTKEQNIKWIKENFLELAHKFDVYIAVENVFKYQDDDMSKGIIPACTSTPNEFKELLDEINDDHVVACVDIGHAEIDVLHTSAVDMIKTLGSKVKALHIHDNDHYHDSHQMPYTHKINYSKVLEALKEINYQGNITFEVETCYSRGEDPTASLPKELYVSFIKLQNDIGNYFVSVLDKK